MHPNEELLHRFYQSFQQKDYANMADCYHKDVVFSDPAFPRLLGWKAGAMWHMLCQRGKDLVLTFENVTADENTGSADWNATYTLSMTGRKIHNKIHAQFEFQEGKITKHTDTFDFRRWSSMAFGLVGTLLGWTSFFQKKVQKQAQKGLEQFIKKENLGPSS